MNVVIDEFSHAAGTIRQARGLIATCHDFVPVRAGRRAGR